MAQVEFDVYITPDGDEYQLGDDQENRMILSGISGQGMPPLEYTTQRGPNQHGETVVKYRLQPRVMQMLLRQNNYTRQAYWDNRARLIDVLRANRQLTLADRPLPGRLRKIMPDGAFRDIDVLIAQGPEFQPAQEWNEWSFEEALRFIAHDPTFYDPVPVTVPAAIPANSQLAFPASFPASFGASAAFVDVNHHYDGTWLTYPVITLTGPLTAVVIENLTTGEAIQFTHILEAGESAVMDLRFGYKTVVNPDLPANDPAANLIGAVDGDLGMFHLEPAPLAPGGINQLRFFISGLTSDGLVSLEYHTRYIGI